MGATLLARRGGAANAGFSEITARAPSFDQNGKVPLIQMGGRFANGEASQGLFVVVDPIANTDNQIYLPPHDLVRWVENAPGCDYWLAQGRVGGIEVGKGALPEDDHLEWGVTTEDCNMDLGGLAFTEDWVRGAETDYARLVALQAYTFNGTSSTRPNSNGVITYRPSTLIVVSSTHLAPNTNTVSMPAKTYPAGTQPREVIDDCASSAGKLFGVVLHHAPVGGSLVLTYSFNADSDGGDSLVWSGLLSNQAGGANGTSHYYFDAHSNSLPANGYAFTPGQQIQVTGYGATDGESLLVEFLDSGNNVLGGPHYVFQGAGDGGANFGHWGAVDSGVLTAPASTVKWRFNKTSHGGSSGIDFDELRVSLTPDSTDCTHLCLLYILETDHTTYASAVKISDEISEIDSENLTAPVFGPHWKNGKGQVVDGQSNISGLVSRYGTGTAFINNLNASVGNQYEYWVEAYQDSDSVNATQAALRAGAISAYRRLYDETDRVSVKVKAEQTYLLTAGMSLKIKASAGGGGGANIDTYLDRRIAQCVWEPLTDGYYFAHLELARGIRRLPPSGGKPQPASSAAGQPPSGTAVPTYAASGSVGTSQLFLPVDSILPYPPTVAKAYTNKSGGSVAAGDVVVFDSANDDAFTTTTSASETRLVGIAQATIANNASGVVATSGYVPLVNTTASVTRGYYGATSTTVKKAVAAATRAAGAFCEFLTGGTTPDAILFGVPDGSSSAGSVATDTIWDAKGDLAAATGADAATKLTVGANNSVLVPDSSVSNGLKWVASPADATKYFDGSGAFSVPGSSGVLGIIPTVTQSTSNFQVGATTNVATLGSVPTRGLIAVVMQSSATDPTSITQTNVTWTKRSTGNGNSQGVNIWTGAVSGTAGTTVTATWAGSTKSQLDVYEMAHADFTATGTAITTTGASTANPTELGPLTTPSDGDICVFGNERNAIASSYGGMNLPYYSASNFGGQGWSGVFFFHGSASSWQIPSAAAAYFATMMKIS